MARTVPTTGQKLNFLLFLVISILILYFDLSSNNFQNIKNGFKSFKISSYFILKEITVEPLKFLQNRYKTKSSLIKENEILREKLKLSDLNNFIISKDNIFTKNKEILEDVDKYNFFYDVAKLRSINPNMFKCCDKHRMQIEVIAKDKTDNIEKFVFNKIGIIGQIIYQNKYSEVLLLTDTSHSLPVKSESGNFFCNARGSGREGYIICKYNPLVWSEEIIKNQIFYTSGMGGIYPKDIEVGHVTNIEVINSNEQSLLIKLNASPLDSNIFGVLKN